MLNQQQYDNKWNEIKGGIRNLWGNLSDQEIEAAKDNLSDLTDVIESRYHESKSEILKKLNKLMDSFDNDTDKNLDPDVASYQRSPVDHHSFEEDRIARH